MNIQQRQNGIAFAVRLTAKGGSDAIEGWAKGADGRPYLKARVAAPREDGKANTALIALLADALGIAKSRLRIASGFSARLKRVEADGDRAALVARLAQWEKGP